MIRRTFQLPAYSEVVPPCQVLVTYDALTDTLHVALRAAQWETWSRPLDEIDGTRQDDAEPGYRPMGLRYDDPAAQALGALPLIKEWDEITAGRGRMVIIAPADVLDQIEFVTVDVPPVPAEPPYDQTVDHEQ